MAHDLRSAVSQLAYQFARELVEALRGASVEDLALEARRLEGPLPASRPSRSAKKNGAAPVPKRRSSEPLAADLEKKLELMVRLVRGRPGLRAEQIRRSLGLEREVIRRLLAAALTDKRLTKRGERRATSYFAA